MAAFATVAELESLMGTTGLGARGTAMLDYASALIRLHTGQDISVQTGRQEEWAGEWDRYYLEVTERPVTALTLTVAGVAYTAFWANYLAGQIWRTDGTPWSTGPIVVTYDSGYASDSDEIVGVKSICLEVAARALGGNTFGFETYGTETPELRGAAPSVFLTEDEKRHLDRFGLVGVA